MARISTRLCMLVLTSAFLVCEIVVGRICRSLLIAVDSFHTLYVFIHLSLSALKNRPSSPLSPDTTSGPSLPHISAPEGPPYDEHLYKRMRLQPFGVLISALLMASQCVSISLEILTHLLQPEAIQHPLLSIVVGGASLLFNVLVWVWRRRSSGTDEAADRISTHLRRNDPHSASESKDHLQDDVLMFCNPKASSVLDPDQGSQDESSELPNLSVINPVPESRIGESSPEIIQPTEQLPEEPRLSACTEPTVSQCVSKGSRDRRPQFGCISVIQDLVCSVLMLANGLVLLLSEAHCHRPHSDCHLLVYLDAVFSTVGVLVLLSAALPKLHRYGLLALQAVPLHLSVGQVRLCLGEVPGVLSVHELHVWELSDALTVASLHVHCPDGLTATDFDVLMAKIKDVLATFGIEHCTVQPEFVASGAGDGSGRSVCSLRCGQECAEKLCCSHILKTESPVGIQEEKPCSPASADEIRDVVIENTYL
ncbi:proton-coupled zinc antiporter SLC30A1 [Pseudorasbora parva]|uniref:proton-coupled zinc antiporter SLC30A1 n=1 Tax=Pseudorasbora parva TaxID=51549 RepID=UPI00351DE600